MVKCGAKLVNRGEKVVVVCGGSVVVQWWFSLSLLMPNRMLHGELTMKNCTRAGMVISLKWLAPFGDRVVGFHLIRLESSRVVDVVMMLLSGGPCLLRACIRSDTHYMNAST